MDKIVALYSSGSESDNQAKPKSLHQPIKVVLAPEVDVTDM